MMAVVFLAFVIPVLCYLYFRMYKRGVVVQCGKREKIFAVIYPLLCLVVEGIIVWDGPKGDATRAGLTIMSIIAAMLLPIFIYYIRVSQHYQKLTISQEQYMQTELEHFMQYKQAQEETARFRHDIRNNLLCVKTMLQEGKSAEAQEYLKDLLSISDGLRKKYITGDEMLDCVIGMKTEIMDEKGINFTLDGVVAGGLQWRVMDVCAVFANAFDNAIEACEKLPQEDRFINLTIKATERFWFLTLQNPVQEKVNTKRLFMKNGGYTSKEDAKQHGIGTYNMKRVVESHGGMMKATCQDNVFALEIIIDKLQILNAS
jgi:sensor histidine kinase regulating citrate/malate metabolism